MTKPSFAIAGLVLGLGACSHTAPAPAAPPPAAAPASAEPPPALDVKVGRCADVDKLAESKAAGFD